MPAEILDEGLDDVEAICVSWLEGLQPAGQVANTIHNPAYPFIWVNFIDGNEDVDCGWGDDVVSIHTLVERGDGSAAAIRSAKNEADRTHRRMLLLARHLEDVALPGGRVATIDYVDVAMRPRWEKWADDQILRKVGRYRIGLSYAPVT